MNFDGFDLVVIGSGFFGTTIAERAARELGLTVAVIDKRTHFGGNSYSEINQETGIEVHPYGTHIFHTNSEEVWTYINKFTEFTDYRHRVFTVHGERVFSMPINLHTISSFFGRHFTPDEARALVAREMAADSIGEPANLEEKAIKSIGRPLYEAFIRGYTMKQWQTDPKQLPASIIGRLPVRFTFDDRYFFDRYEGMPRDGYGAIFRNMLSNPKISLMLGVDFFDIRHLIPSKTLVIYTGAIDRYYDYQFGELGWRTVDLEWEVANTPDFQGTSVMNYADADIPFTRIHEFRHLHPERPFDGQKTIIAREFSRFAKAGDEPYYPIATPQDRDLYERYVALTAQEPNVIFGGRLGTYRYLDMHQAIGAALKCFDTQVAPRFTTGKPLSI
ncbi:UDP-galactopyranose mutase [Niveispirillum irakense]|uniref:UDP-galactopyranose mutase n=1 Tax=Niveispirillum irakense TaxID=34011 RepID=UPI000419351C|nr:UDP-galactopyranose mutase [Niveispirillum irakense]